MEANLVKPTVADAAEAVEQVRAAAGVLARVRNVRFRVSVAWQQIDDIEAEAAQELKRRLTAAAEAWLAEQAQAISPHGEVRYHCEAAADVNGLHMTLPMIWLPQGVDT